MVPHFLTLALVEQVRQDAAHVALLSCLASTFGMDRNHVSLHPRFLKRLSISNALMTCEFRLFGTMTTRTTGVLQLTRTI